MNKSMLYFMLLLSLAPVSAWNYDNHHRIIDTVFYSLDDQTQQNLNLTNLREGSIIPDRDFHDTRRHHYPPSYEQAQIWLNKTKFFLLDRNWDNASLAFGIASHYISDSFAAPHNVEQEPSSLHSAFESVPYETKTRCQPAMQFSQDQLHVAADNWKHWAPWVESRDPTIPQQEMEQATNLILKIALLTFNASCYQHPGQVLTSRGIHLPTKIVYHSSWKQVVFGIAVMTLLYLGFKLKPAQ